jgi:hypothetical protein
LIIKKIESAHNVSKFEYFYDKGSYGLVIESSRFTAFVEGENKVKNFGKLGFFDKMHNYEHKSNYNVTNGVLFIESVSNKEKKEFTKFDAVIGFGQISKLELITPTINANLTTNPLGAKKTVNFNWVSPRYEQKTIIEVIPKSEIKIESLSLSKVEPFERFKVDALITIIPAFIIPSLGLDLKIKKFKGADNVSKFEYFFEKEICRLVIESSKFTAFVEANNRENFGKLGIFDKVHNYEHKINYNVKNDVLFIESVSNKENKQFTKLNAVIALEKISKLELITPTVNAILMANPWGAKKTVNFNWVSPRYEQKTIIEVVPESEIKIESLSQRKVEPFERFKVDALITRNNDSFVTLSAPSLDWSWRKTKSVMPKVIINMTLNGYNKVQEYDANKNVDALTNSIIIPLITGEHWSESLNENFHPLTNAIVIFLKYMKTFIINA